MNKTIDEALTYALENEIDYARLAIKVMQASPATFLELVKPDLDKFAADLLQSNPEAFLTFSQQIVSGLKSMESIHHHLKRGNLVSAIKQLREDTGMGLMEAKNVISVARDDLVKFGSIDPSVYPGATPTPRSTLNAQQLDMVRSIINSYKV